MKKFIQIFFLLSRGKQIAVSVALAHLLVLFSLTCHHLATRRWRTPRPMVIKTISPLAPVEKKIITGVEKPKSTQTASVEKKAAAPVTAKKEKAPAGKIVATGKGKNKPLPPPKQKVEENVLKEISESFAALSSEPKKPTRSALNIPVKSAAKMPEPEIETGDDATYDEYLIAFLQSALDLPEFGDVKMEIEIDSSGKIVESRILESKSSKNAKFLKDELATLNFPIPFDVEKKHKFTIVFRNK
ncbi:MAG: hypothetical protein K1X28_07595 [Parachlamydiales bacterium]|nr:hypothetical protein [Parachlamydiales bacterium]